MDHHLFAEIYREHARAIHGHVVRMTADPVAAEDIVSLTFLEAWRLREGFSGVENRRAWLFGVATNVLRNHRRAARRHRAAMSRMPPPPQVPDFSEGVVSGIEDRRRMEAALRALGRLRRSDREVLLLHLVSGLTHEEVARACGVSVGTARSRLSRARSRLRKLTDEQVGAGREAARRAWARPVREGSR
ncbi:RNA polymerase sigma factor [Streptomyces sp. BI20]|uniref:RNA polymerase sigma factor n=1 Tax=Streptomyces sp. BI20 TaxID=3403460 RepID=UPI003C734957